MPGCTSSADAKAIAIHADYVTELKLQSDTVVAPSDDGQRTPPKKLRYASPDEDKVRFAHARKSEEKLLLEIEQCRIEYLTLAEKLRIF